MRNTVIYATGSYTSGRVVGTQELIDEGNLVNEEGQPVPITQKNLEPIGVLTRMWANPGEMPSDMGAIALTKCFKSSRVTRQDIGMVITTHNTGDDGDIIPAISSKVAYKSGLSDVEFFDVIEGCQGWCKAVRIADTLIRNGYNSKIAVVGAEKLSPIRGRKYSSLLFADGAGAVVLGGIDGDEPSGILSSHFGGMSSKHAALKMIDSVNASLASSYTHPVLREMDMDGYGIYEIASRVIPETFFALIEKYNVAYGKQLAADDVKYLLKHQASEKILSRSSLNEIRKMLNAGENYRAYLDQYRHDKVPNSVKYLGNSSVATIPTLLDVILKKKVDNPGLEDLVTSLKHYAIVPDDIFAVMSVGAGVGWGGHLIKMHPVYWDNLK